MIENIYVIISELIGKLPQPFGVPFFEDWISLIALSSFVIYLYKSFTSNYKKNDKKLKRFWDPKDSKWILIKPRVEKVDNSKAYERVEDILATAEFRNMLGKFNYPYSEYYDNEIPSENNYLIYFCGPVGSKVSKQFQDENKLKFRIIEENNNRYIINTQNKIKLQSPMDAEDQRVDHAIIARIIRDEKNIILCWGIHGIGTYGAARYLTNEKFYNKYYKLIKNKNFMQIISVEFNKMNEVISTSEHSNLILGDDVTN